MVHNHSLGTKSASWGIKCSPLKLFLGIFIYVKDFFGGFNKFFVKKVLIMLQILREKNWGAKIPRQKTLLVGILNGFGWGFNEFSMSGGLQKGRRYFCYNLVQNVVETWQFVSTIEYNQPTQNTMCDCLYISGRSHLVAVHRGSPAVTAVKGGHCGQAVPLILGKIATPFKNRANWLIKCKNCHQCRQPSKWASIF